MSTLLIAMFHAISLQVLSRTADVTQPYCLRRDNAQELTVQNRDLVIL